MSENAHTLTVGQIDVVSHCQIRVNDEGIDSLESQIKAIRQEQEAEKPKPGDFGINVDGHCVYMTFAGWMNLGPSGETKLERDQVHLCGNVADLLRQGPIVVGMTVETAQLLRQNYVRCEGPDWQYSLRDQIMAALARYEAKP